MERGISLYDIFPPEVDKTLVDKFFNEYKPIMTYSHSVGLRFMNLYATHLKSGNKYKVIGMALDATNVTAGRIMIIYERSMMTFSRELSEFMDKFKYCNNEN